MTRENSVRYSSLSVDRALLCEVRMHRAILLAVLAVAPVGCADRPVGPCATDCVVGKADGTGDRFVIKQTAMLEDFGLASGQRVPVKLGYETYGALNQAGDNVVVLAPFLAGHSHAAGRYGAADPAPGWWYPLVGPGRAIDTDRFFVIATDALALPRSKPSQVISTGPASRDPAGRRYGPDFPQISFQDQVEAQYEILRSLGVRHVRAVLGPSMGGMIAWQWGVSHPGFVDLVVPVAAPLDYTDGERSGFTFSQALIVGDPDWQGGRYYDTGREPNLGVALVLAMLNGVIVPAPSADAAPSVGWDELERRYQRFRALTPEQAMQQVPNLQPLIDRAAEEFDGEHFVYTLDAFGRYDVGAQLSPSSGQVRFVALGFKDDQLVKRAHLEAVDQRLSAAHIPHRVEVLDGGHGHLSCLLDPEQLEPIIREELK
jgi:homoserine O-acetyltransferase